MENNQPNPPVAATPPQSNNLRNARITLCCAAALATIVALFMMAHLALSGEATIYNSILSYEFLISMVGIATVSLTAEKGDKILIGSGITRVGNSIIRCRDLTIALLLWAYKVCQKVVNHKKMQGKMEIWKWEQ